MSKQHRHHWTWAAAIITIVCLSLLISPVQPVQAYDQPALQAPQLTSPTDQSGHCPHTIPGCRWKVFIYMAQRWFNTHLRLDPTRWAMPVYVAFDQTNQWQQVSVLCLHLTRSGW